METILLIFLGLRFLLIYGLSDLNTNLFYSESWILLLMWLCYVSIKKSYFNLFILWIQKLELAIIYTSKLRLLNKVSCSTFLSLYGAYNAFSKCS